MRPRLLLSLGGGAALLLATGCSVPTTPTATADGQTQAPSSNQTFVAPADPASSPNPAGSPTSGGGSGSAGPAPSGGASPGEQPVAKRPGSIEKTKVAATLYPVRRVGQTASVNLYLAAQDPDATFLLFNSLGDGNTETSSKSLTSVDGLRLIDPVAKKAYLPAVTADGRCVCSPDDGATTDVSSAMWVTVTFAAPPVELGKINVSVPTFGTFTDVPIL